VINTAMYPVLKRTRINCPPDLVNQPAILKILPNTGSPLYRIYPMEKQRIQKLRAKVALLEARIAHERSLELAGLPKKFGFDSAAEFLEAVKSAATNGRKYGRKAGRPNKADAGSKIRKRAIITAAIRARVKKLVQAGKTGSKIAKSVGISLPSVQNIKKALGLVKARGSKAKGAPTKKEPARKRPARNAPAKKATAVLHPPPPIAASGE